MARPKTFRRSFVMRWTVLEETLVGYYAMKFGKDQSGVVRSMIRKFARADTDLKTKAVMDHYAQHILPLIQDDPEAVEDARHHFQHFWASVVPRP